MEKGPAEEIKTNVERCRLCKVGKVSAITRSDQAKGDLVIYGRNGMRLARHVESRCGLKGCKAGYYAGYMTFKGRTIYDDTTLKVFTI